MEINDKPIGFIGLGTMGKPIAEKLLEKGFKIVCFDKVKPKFEKWKKDEACVVNGIAGVKERCSTVLLSLPGPKEIEEVILGRSGILDKDIGQISSIIDLSTNSIAGVKKANERALSLGISYLDAPVSGGKRAAEKGALTIMVSGDQSCLENHRSMLDTFAAKVFFMGRSGLGTLTKLINNSIFLSSAVLLQEGFVLGSKAGLGAKEILEVLRASSAAPITKIAPLTLSKNVNQNIFSLSIAEKDLALATEAAEDEGFSLQLSLAALSIYRDALKEGLGQKDFFATLKSLEKTAGAEVEAIFDQ